MPKKRKGLGNSFPPEPTPSFKKVEKLALIKDHEFAQNRIKSIEKNKYILKSKLYKFIDEQKFWGRYHQKDNPLGDFAGRSGYLFSIQTAVNNGELDA